MALTIKRPAGFAPAPAGLHHANCIRIIDLGTQKSQFAGKVKIQAKILMIWELAGEKREDGQPYIVSERYTASLHEKAKLREVLCGWLGRGLDGEEFDLTAMLGKPCAVNITHRSADDGNVYADVASVSPPMAGFQVPPPQSTPAAFDLSDPDWALFNEFSENTQKLIRQSPEYAALDLPDHAPPPLNTAAPEVKLPVDAALMQTLRDNIASGQTTAAEVLEMGYVFTEDQLMELQLEAL